MASTTSQIQRMSELRALVAGAKLTMEKVRAKRELRLLVEALAAKAARLPALVEKVTAQAVEAAAQGEPAVVAERNAVAAKFQAEIAAIKSAL